MEFLGAQLFGLVIYIFFIQNLERNLNCALFLIDCSKIRAKEYKTLNFDGC